MARNQSKFVTFPSINQKFGSPKYTFVKNDASVTLPSRLTSVPPLNICMEARKILFNMDQSKSKTDVRRPGMGHSDMKV